MVTLRASYSCCAVYLNRSSLWVCARLAGGRAVSVTTITRNCVHLL